MLELGADTLRYTGTSRYVSLCDPSARLFVYPRWEIIAFIPRPTGSWPSSERPMARPLFALRSPGTTLLVPGVDPYARPPTTPSTCPNAGGAATQTAVRATAISDRRMFAPP